MNERAVVGFGCPNDIDPHHFKVLVPSSRGAAVVIVEHFGLAGGSNGLPEQVERCHLARAAWTAIADAARRVLNERLKEKGLPPGRWLVGENRVERLLGKELCLLAWAVERADAGLVPNGIRNWMGYRPEERWWLFSRVAATAGTAPHGDVGWRKAVRVALTESSSEPTAPVPRPAKAAVETAQITLFMKERGSE